MFDEDKLEYEGDILTLDTTEDGKQYCNVRFVGYGNEQTVWVDQLLESHGEDARKQAVDK